MGWEHAERVPPLVLSVLSLLSYHSAPYLQNEAVDLKITLELK
jgi:hypothetical protein